MRQSFTVTASVIEAVIEAVIYICAMRQSFTVTASVIEAVIYIYAMRQSFTLCFVENQYRSRFTHLYCYLIIA